jgi:hypothetical protein
VKRPDWNETLERMVVELSSHPWWDRMVKGTPLENDIPVRAAMVAQKMLIDLEEKEMADAL